MEPNESLTLASAAFVVGASGLTIGVFSIARQEDPMREEKTTRLRQRMIEDMRIRGMGEKAQQAHIRAVKDFAAVGFH